MLWGMSRIDEAATELCIWLLSTCNAYHAEEGGGGKGGAFEEIVSG